MNCDCLYNIFLFLNIKDNINISLVNKIFYIISKNELFWKSYYENKFYNIKCNGMFYQNYKKCYMLNKFLVKYRKDINRIDKELYLSYNQLQSIPSDIGQLNMLHTLYLHNNQLQSIPPELGQLKMLQTLYLNNNQLQSIPTDLGQLNMLRALYLDNNQLKLVPENINISIIKKIEILF